MARRSFLTNNQLKIFLIGLIIFLFTLFSPFASSVLANDSSVKAESAVVAQPTTPYDSNHKQLLVARSGCCSHHDGACGCSMGSVNCCDGTTSPSCGCFTDNMDTMQVANCNIPQPIVAENIKS